VNKRMRRVAAWVVLFLGLFGLAHQISRAVPRDNRLVIGLSGDDVVREVRVDVTSPDGQAWRTIELHPLIPNPRRLECLLKLPPGEYRIDATYDMRPAGRIDKDHESDWTRMGVQHQIRLEGEDHHFPPPEHEAK
jgi:hypothetical protein